MKVSEKYEDSSYKVLKFKVTKEQLKFLAANFNRFLFFLQFLHSDSLFIFRKFFSCTFGFCFALFPCWPWPTMNWPIKSQV